MVEPIAGKFLLEILTKGMYSNPMHIYREYIQNCSDSIDKALKSKIVTPEDAEIHINIDQDHNTIVIRDNGVGISKEDAFITLMNVGASEKDGKTERGFRGIGRLGGLAYANSVIFATSYKGEPYKTVLICDCSRMQTLLQKSNTETKDIIETFQAITRIFEYPEEQDAHYFEVQLIGVTQDSGLLDEEKVISYLSETAPVDFDSQQFVQARKIKEYFEEKGYPITCYNIYRGERRKPVYKLYSRSLTTGKQERSRTKDYVRDVEFIYKEASDGKPLYIGWLAITDFSGIISDDSIQGIRLRKGNILVGNNRTFAKFFPSEGHNANRMFAGEIHVLHDDLIPNSQRDDFEPTPTYTEMRKALTEWAGQINKKYRRGTSEVTSAIRKINELNEQQENLEKKIETGAITSDEKREQILAEISDISEKRSKETNKIQKARERGIIDEERTAAIEDTLKKANTAQKKLPSIGKTIVSADYATKNDLPSSYSREERKLYQRIIAIIDFYFGNDTQTASALRDRIKAELSEKKK